MIFFEVYRYYSKFDLFLLELVSFSQHLSVSASICRLLSAFMSAFVGVGCWGDLLDPRLHEGPMNSLPYVRTFGFFSELSYADYLIFCMRLGVHSNSKLTEPDFSRKIWFSQNFEKRAKNCPEIRFFKFYSKPCP